MLKALDSFDAVMTTMVATKACTPHEAMDIQRMFYGQGVAYRVEMHGRVDFVQLGMWIATTLDNLRNGIVVSV